jgi:hypothetical protein
MYTIYDPPKNWKGYGQAWLELAIPLLNQYLARYHNMGKAMRLTYTDMIRHHGDPSKTGPKPVRPPEPKVEPKKPDVTIKLKPVQPSLFDEMELRYPSLTRDPR